MRKDNPIIITEPRAILICKHIMRSAEIAGRDMEFPKLQLFSELGAAVVIPKNLLEILDELKMINKTENKKLPVKVLMEERLQIVYYFESFLPSQLQLTLMERYGVSRLYDFLKNYYSSHKPSHQ